MTSVVGDNRLNVVVPWTALTGAEGSLVEPMCNRQMGLVSSPKQTRRSMNGGDETMLTKFHISRS